MQPHGFRPFYITGTQYVHQVSLQRGHGSSALSPKIIDYKRNERCKSLCFNTKEEQEGLKVQQDHKNSSSLLKLIKDCGKQKNLWKGSRIHVDILKRGLVKENICVATALLRMYADCGALEKAQEVFDELPARDVVCWSALIGGYAQQGFGNEALNCFKKMQDEGFLPNTATFVSALRACSSIGAIDKGEEIHGEVSKQGLLKKSIVLGTALVSMYAKCGALSKAQQVLDELPVRNVISWTALIDGYVHRGLGAEALDCFGRMQDEGVSPNAVTFLTVLKACGSVKAAKQGEEVHAEVKRQQLLGKHALLGSALVDMYTKCGMLTKAREVFDELPVQDVVAWTALIAGYSQEGLDSEAFDCFTRMQDKGLSPDAVTFVAILKACSSVGAVDKGEEIHAEVCRLGLLESNVLLGTTLVDMYAKCGALEKAQKLFDELPARDIALWSVLIAGYAQHGLNSDALKCFGQIQDEGILPDTVTYVCMLKVCGCIGAMGKGKEIHDELGSRGMLGRNMALGSALVDMYAKYGALVEAQEVFDDLPVQDVIAWTALIAGYAQLGKVRKVFDSFSRLIERLEPTAVTFVALLSVSSHAGLVAEGQMCLDTMSTVYSIIPTLEIYTCMVDLFSRAGRFDKAVNMMTKVSPSDCCRIWPALLGACQKWENVEVGKWAFDHAVSLDEMYASAYVCMSNIYLATDLQNVIERKK